MMLSSGAKTARAGGACESECAAVGASCETFDFLAGFGGDGENTAHDGCPFSLSDDDDDEAADVEGDVGQHTDACPINRAVEPEHVDVGSLFDMPKLSPSLIGDMSAAEALATLSDVSYWQKACPWLHVADPDMLAAANRGSVHASPETVDRCRERMTRDGYFNLPPSTTAWSAEGLHSLARAVIRLEELGWPASFLLMYDEAWALVHQLKEVIFLTTGNTLLYDFSVFHVSGHHDRSGIEPAAHLRGSESNPIGAVSGWPPHRDRGSDASAERFREDGSPEYCTAWIALTSASPTNSCLYVVPKAHDGGYHGGDGGRNPLSRIFSTAGAFQNIRALPCDAGEVIVFSHRLLHWGSAADALAREDKGGEPARVALAFSSASPAFERGYLAAGTSPMPPLTARAGLVCGLAIMYVANENPGKQKLDVFYKCFLGDLGAFDCDFVKLVATNYRAASAEYATQ